ncbi:alpha/beta fold hydrolase [Candidatus Bipolaricaulota bacterium]
MSDSLRQYSFRASEVVLNCVEGSADGPPILLLHGMCDRWQGLLPVIDHVSPRWHVHAFDMRGHGMSEHVSGGYLPRDYGRDAEEFLCDRLTEPAILVGHSAGGLLALWCAARHPDRVRAVVNGDLFGSTERLAALIRRPESVAFYKALQPLAGQPENQIAASPLASRMPSQTLAEWSIATSLLDPATLSHHADGDGITYVAGIDMDAILAQVTCPVLLVAGDPSCGGVMSEEDVGYACDQLADAHHASLDEVGHGLGLTTARPEQLLQAIDDFIESLP